MTTGTNNSFDVSICIVVRILNHFSSITAIRKGQLLSKRVTHDDGMREKITVTTNVTLVIRNYVTNWTIDDRVFGAPFYRSVDRY